MSIASMRRIPVRTSRWVVSVVCAVLVCIITAPAGAGLTAYYPFDGTAADSSGNNRNGTASDNGTVGIYWGSGGMIGSSVGFDGDGPADNTNTLARVEVPASSISAAAGSLAFWAKLNSSEPYTTGGRNNNVYFFGLKGSGTYDKIFIYNQNDTNLKVEVGNKSTANAYVLNRSVWYHIALTWDGSEFAVYVNGAEAKRLTYASLVNIPAVCDIGNSGQTGHKFSFHGLLDDFRIYNTALTAEELFSLYGGAGNPSPASGAQDLGLSQTLSWSAGAGATSHNLYFGSTNPPAFIANVLSTNYQLPTMNYSTQYWWRIDEVNSGGASITGRLWSFSTLYLPAAASNPDPASGSVNVAPDKVLGWTAGARTTSFDVYFGTTNTPAFIQNQTSTQYAIRDTLYATIYYWRISSINQAGTTAGPLWSFKTATKRPTNPSPANGATNVAVTATLSWTAGYGATARDVYFGTAENPDFIDTRTSTSYQPPVLKYSTRYYWHIDELSPGGMTGGDLWSFTTVAAPMATKAVSPNPVNSAKDVPLDVILSWTAGANVTSHDVRFGTALSCDPPLFEALPPFIGNQTQTSFDPSGSIYVTDWDAVATFAANWLDPYTFTDYAAMAPGMRKQVPGGELTLDTVYYWKIDEIGAGNTAAGDMWSFRTMSDKAFNPVPADGAKNQMLDVDLSWTAGYGATSHDVYFGNTNPPGFKTNTTNQDYQLPMLAEETTYYWRIDEKNGGGTVAGLIWSFTTYKPGAPAADFTASPRSGGVPLTVHFTDLSTGTIESRLWDFGDGTASTEQNPTHVYNEGCFDVELTVSGAFGSDTIKKTGFILSDSGQPPYVRVQDPRGSSGWPWCGVAPYTIDFVGRLLLGVVTSWHWDFGDGTEAFVQNPTKVYPGPGEYLVVLTGSGPSGSSVDKSTIVVSAQGLPERTIWYPSDGDGFGSSIDVDDTVAIVGAAGDDDMGTDAGAAYIYRYNGSAWVEEAKLTAFDASPGDQFGWSVAIDNNVAVVGQYYYTYATGTVGSAYVFRYDGINWLPEAKLESDTPQGTGVNNGDDFAWSVAVSGDYIIVGAFCDDTAGDMAGAAYIFNYSAGSWSKQAKLIGSDTEFWDWFGYSVDIDSNYAVIGAVYDIVKGSEEDGSAYIFYRSGTTWTQQKKLTVQGPYDRIRFGHAVSIDGDYVAVLEEFFSTAYVYNRSGTSWNLQGTLTLQDPVWENTSLASDVFIDNEFVLMVRDVGEFPVQSGGYMFKRSGTSWSRYSKLAPVGGAVLGRCAISAATQTAFLTPNYGGYVYEFDISRGSSDIQVSATVDTATEGGSAGEFTISRHGDTASAVTVYYSISGTATPSSDYTALSGAVNMPAGSSSAKIAVTPIDDTVREVSETVVLSLNASSGYVLGYPSIATVTIKDNEPRPVITIAATTPNVPEAGPSQGVFTFSRTAVDIQLPLTVFYTVAGAAGNGVDYSPLTGTVTFSANNASVTVLVNPIADNRMETDETVLVTIDPNELYYTVGANSSATVTILDDDMPASYDVITHDGFEDGWGNFAYSGWAYMRCEDGYSYPSSGSCAAYLEFDSPAGDESMIYYSQPKNVSSYTHLRIQFDCIGIDLLSGDTWLVQYYDGSTWRIIDELRYGVNFDNYIYYFKQYDLYKGQYNFPTNAKIRFMCNGADGWRYVYLDEILVLGE